MYATLGEKKTISSDWFKFYLTNVTSPSIHCVGWSSLAHYHPSFMCSLPCWQIVVQWVVQHTTDKCNTNKCHSIWLEGIKSYLSLYVCAYSQWLSCGLHWTTAPSKIDLSCCKDLWSHQWWWYLSDSGTPLLPCSWARNTQYQPSREVPGTNMLLYSYFHVKQIYYNIH